MMTVAEAERVRRAAEKGRSASFCATGQSHSLLGAAHSSCDVSSGAFVEQQQLTFMQTVTDNHANQSPGSRLRPGHGSRRSQSCRVQGSRPPRVQKKYDTPKESAGKIDQDSETNISDNIKEVPVENDERTVKDDSYNSFLKKVGSCGRLITLAPEDDQDGSPSLRRSASARRPRPPSSPNHSPTPTRVVRPVGTCSVKSRTCTRKGTTTTTGSTKRSAAAAAVGYLDVRPSGSAETLDPDAYLLRNFSTTNKGIINRGDSFRRRRSRSNSVQPPAAECPPPPQVNIPPQVGELSPARASPELTECKEAPERYRVVILGAAGVGKTALLHQFRTSECINAYDCSGGGEDEEDGPISIVLNSIESEINFINVSTAMELQAEIQRSSSPHGWLVVYSITDKASFQRANEELTKLHSGGQLKSRVIILVGNKCELVRSRAVSDNDGRDLACSFGAKFIEISVGMNHKCDELLVGILHQLRLKEEAASIEGPSDEKEKTPWIRNRSLMRASMKAKRLVNRIMGKSDSKHKLCEDFLN